MAEYGMRGQMRTDQGLVGDDTGASPSSTNTSGSSSRQVDDCSNDWILDHASLSFIVAVKMKLMPRRMGTIVGPQLHGCGTRELGKLMNQVRVQFGKDGTQTSPLFVQRDSGKGAVVGLVPLERNNVRKVFRKIF